MFENEDKISKYVCKKIVQFLIFLWYFRVSFILQEKHFWTDQPTLIETFVCLWKVVFYFTLCRWCDTDDNL